MTARSCPTCAGAWLYGLTFDHAVVGCPIRDADDATVAADNERLALIPHGYRRDARPHERTLTSALGIPVWAGPIGTAPPLVTIVSSLTGSIIRRRFQYGLEGKVFDPDEVVT